MVSIHKYYNFKYVSRAGIFQPMVFMVLLMIIVAAKPQITLFFIGVLGILSGPMAGVCRMFDNHEKT